MRKNILGFTRIAAENAEMGITDAEYKEQLEWTVKLDIWEHDNPFKPFNVNEVDAVPCNLGEEKQYSADCHFWPGAYYRVIIMADEKYSESYRVAYNKDLNGLDIIGFCRAEMSQGSVRDLDIADDAEYWKQIMWIAADEVSEGTHCDSPEDYESKLDFYISNATDPSFIDLLNGMTGLDETTLLKVQNDIVGKIEEIADWEGEDDEDEDKE